MEREEMDGNGDHQSEDGSESEETECCPLPSL